MLPVTAMSPPTVKLPVVLAVVNAPVPGVTLPIATACRPPVVVVSAVKLPTLTLAHPELVILPVVIPVSVVAMATKAASASFHTNAVFTEPYPASVCKLRLAIIPISYVGTPA